MNWPVRRRRPSMSARKLEWSQTPARASGWSICSSNALMPPISIELKSPCTFQLAECGPNRPGSPLGDSKSTPPRARPVRLSTWLSMWRRMVSMDGVASLKRRAARETGYGSLNRRLSPLQRAVCSRLFVQPAVDQALHHAGIGKRGGIAEVFQLIAGDLAQDAPHDLARAGLRQRGRPLDQLRLGETADLLAHH